MTERKKNTKERGRLSGFLLLVIGIFAYAWQVVMAPLQAESIVLRVCDKATCKPAAGVHEPLIISSITAMTESADCPDRCVQVTGTAGNTAHVVGTLFDLRCKAWGGNFCRWSREVMPRREALRLHEMDAEHQD